MVYAATAAVDLLSATEPEAKAAPGHPRHLVVAGAGYVGLATATGFALQGHLVDLVETNRALAECLSRCQIPFYEPSLNEAFASAVQSGRIQVHDGYGPHLGRADFAFICTPTPPKEDGYLDLTQVYSAAGTLIDSCTGRLRLVVRSTVNPGTSSHLLSWVRELRDDVDVLANPEFLREGSCLVDFESPARVVIGGNDAAAVADLAALYAFARTKLIQTDPTTAEIIKLGANSALAVRISLANELAHLAHSLGADVEAALAAIGDDPRIGSSYLTPGIGFGGSCLPKDLAALRTAALRQGIETAVFDGAQRTNEIALERLIEQAMTAREEGMRAQVSIIGTAFKPGSDSVRNSRAILLIRALLQEGIEVTVFDPLAESSARGELGDCVSYAESLPHALETAHLSIVVDRTLLEGALDGTPEAFPSTARMIDGLGRDVVWPAA
jgi:UDPglucose 6-dehydrogenase